MILPMTIMHAGVPFFRYYYFLFYFLFQTSSFIVYFLRTNISSLYYRYTVKTRIIMEINVVSLSIRTAIKNKKIYICKANFAVSCFMELCSTAIKNKKTNYVK